MLMLKKFKLVKTHYAMSKMAKYYNSVNNEIYYSQTDQKFKTP